MLKKFVVCFQDSFLMSENINNTRSVNVHSDIISEPLSSYLLSEQYYSYILHWQLIETLDPVDISFWTCIAYYLSKC